MQDIIFKEINTTSAEYQQVWQLREDVLRRPLGLSLVDEDLSADADDMILVALHNNKVIACLMLHRLDKLNLKLRQMAVAGEWQGKNVGSALVRHAEILAADMGYSRMLLHARQVAVGFYSRLQYKITSDVFTEVGIPHVVMEKVLYPAIA